MRMLSEFWKKYWLYLVLAVLIGLLWWVFSPKKFRVIEVEADGTVRLENGKKVRLAEVSIEGLDPDKQEKAVYLMTEVTKDRKVMLEKVAGGYKVWLGCRDLILFRDCRKGITLGEVLLRVKMAERR